MQWYNPIYLIHCVLDSVTYGLFSSYRHFPPGKNGPYSILNPFIEKITTAYFCSLRAAEMILTASNPKGRMQYWTTGSFDLDMVGNEISSNVANHTLLHSKALLNSGGISRIGTIIEIGSRKRSNCLQNKENSMFLSIFWGGLVW